MFPGISDHSSKGFRTKKHRGNQTLYIVEQIDTARSVSVPLLPARGRIKKTLNGNNVSGKSDDADGDPSHAVLKRLQSSALIDPSHRHLGNTNASASPSRHPLSPVLRQPLEHFFNNGDQSTPESQQIIRWKRMMDTERAKFSSTCMWCELMFQKVVKETQHLPKPTALRTAVVAMLTSTLIGTVGGVIEPLLRTLFVDLLGSVYYSWEDYLMSGTNEAHVPSDALDDGVGNTYDQPLLRAQNLAGEAFRQQDSTEGIVRETKFLVSSLKQRFTYFQMYEELQAARMNTLGAPARVVLRCIDIWRHRYLRYFFSYWVNCHRQEQRRSNKVLRSSEIFSARRRGKVLKAHFHAWKAYVTDRRHRDMADHEATQKKLMHRMGRHIRALEEENERLKDDVRKLKADHTNTVLQITNMQTLLAKFRQSSDRPEETAAIVGDCAFPPQPCGKKSPVDSTAGNDDDIPSGPCSDRATATPNLSYVSGENPQRNPETIRERNLKSLMRASSDLPGPSRSLDRNVDLELIDSPCDVESSFDTSNPPNRVQQLKDFLTLGGESGILPTDVKTQRPSSFNFDRNAPKEIVVREKGEWVKRMNYKEVIDWVASRTQMYISTRPNLIHGLRRCTNFTVDFKDSMRLACLMASLGGDQTLVDDVAQRSDLVARAEYCLKLIRCFFDLELDSEIVSDLLAVTAQDIAKAKGGKIARIAFAFYEKFSMVGHHVLIRPVNETIAARLNEVGGYVVPGELTSTSITETETPEAGSDMCSPTKGLSFGDVVNDDFVQPIPDQQFADWYHDLAAPDSEDDELFNASPKRKQSVTDTVNDKMQRRLSQLNFRNAANGQSQQRKDKPSKSAEMGERLNRWLKTKISLNYDSREIPNFSTISAFDVLHGVMSQVFPTGNFSGPDAETKLKRMQAYLQKKLGLPKLLLSRRLGRNARGGRAVDSVHIPLKYILQLLYLYDQDALVDL
jgi:hypothetical protein